MGWGLLSGDLLNNPLQGREAPDAPAGPRGPEQMQQTGQAGLCAKSKQSRYWRKTSMGVGGWGCCLAPGTGEGPLLPFSSGCPAPEL